jgi:hypothetical protein
MEDYDNELRHELTNLTKAIRVNPNDADIPSYKIHMDA